MGVLRILNVALTQLHLNGWAAIKVFWALCLCSSMSAMTRLFLHYFCSRPRDKARWMSLIRIPKCSLLHPFTSFYKNFKIDYFKVAIRTIVGKDYFYDSMGNSFFPSTSSSVLGSTMSTQGNCWLLTNVETLIVSNHSLNNYLLSPLCRFFSHWILSGTLRIRLVSFSIDFHFLL